MLTAPIPAPVRTARPSVPGSPGAEITRDRLEGAVGRRVFSALVLALPALLLGTLIFRYGVDTPWGDQWDGMAHYFERMQAGTLRLSDFFEFHSEHRIGFPRLLSFALAWLTHWNIRAELALIWLLLCLCSLNIWQLARMTGWRAGRSRSWLLLAANVLLFNPVQWENLLWGFQISFIFPLATATAACWTALLKRRALAFSLTALLCCVTTFSIASGFTSWFLVAPILFVSAETPRARAEKFFWPGWAFATAASTALYFHGFTRPSIHPSEAYALAHPWLALEFFLAYFGNPFASGNAFSAAKVAPWLGAVLVGLFAGVLIFLWRFRKNRVFAMRAWPWIGFAGIAFANAFLTTIGRAGFGISAALPARYVSFSILLPIALIFLAPICAIKIRSAKCRTSAHTALVSLAAAFAVLFLCASLHGLDRFAAFQHGRLTGKSALVFSGVLDESVALARHIHPEGAAFLPRIEILDRLGYLHPARLRSRKIAPIARPPSEETRGRLTSLIRETDGRLLASGWSVLPEQHRVGDSVLLAYENAGGEWIIFSRADVDLGVPEVSRVLQDDAYLNCGWSKSWRPGEIPEGTRRIGAWTFNVERCEAFPIGEATL